MKIYTSYFSKLRKIPEDIIPISIARKEPEFFSGLEYKSLAPSWELIQLWKQTQDEEKYTYYYNTSVLGRLNPLNVFRDLARLSGGKDVVLVCYEKPSNFCHRKIVAKWFQNSGIECSEW